MEKVYSALFKYIFKGVLHSQTIKTHAIWTNKGAELIGRTNLGGTVPLPPPPSASWLGQTYSWTHASLAARALLAQEQGISIVPIADDIAKQFEKRQQRYIIKPPINYRPVYGKWLGWWRDALSADKYWTGIFVHFVGQSLFYGIHRTVQMYVRLSPFLWVVLWTRFSCSRHKMVSLS